MADSDIHASRCGIEIALITMLHIAVCATENKDIAIVELDTLALAIAIESEDPASIEAERNDRGIASLVDILVEVELLFALVDVD